MPANRRQTQEAEPHLAGSCWQDKSQMVWLLKRVCSSEDFSKCKGWGETGIDV